MRGRVAYAAFEAFPNHKGAGVRMTHTVSALVDAGWEVHLITLPRRGTQPIPPGVVHHPLRVNRENFLARGVSFRSGVARRLRTIAPDVIHVRGIFEGQAAAAYAAERGRPWIFEVNGLPSVELRYHFPAVARAHAFQVRLRALEAELLAKANVVTTQSEKTLRFLRERGLPETTPATVIPNGADPDLWVPREAPDGPTRVLYAGTISAWQGVGELLMALRRARRELPMQLTIAGRAPRARRKHLERLIRRLKLKEAVELTGPIGPAELAQRVGEAHICVAPLRKDVRNRVQGCSPIKLFEYMSAGRAILTTDLECVREIVTHEQTAITVHVPKPSRLAEQLLRLARDPELRSELGARARAKILESGTWAHRRVALTRVYDTLASTQSATAS